MCAISSPSIPGHFRSIRFRDDSLETSINIKNISGVSFIFCLHIIKFILRRKFTFINTREVLIDFFERILQTSSKAVLTKFTAGDAGRDRRWRRSSLFEEILDPHMM